jgi:diaminopimelate decarboxylase
MAPPPYRHFFSLKSCYLPPVITAVLGQGFGIEVCSPHELALARALAAPAGAIRLHALCLDAQEAEEAVAAQLDLVTIGSLAAARRLCDAAVARGVTTPTAVRVAPATDASNPYLAAGGRLGFSPGDAVLIEVCSLLASCPAIKLVGLHAHTQIEAGDLVGHAEVAEALVALARSLDRELGIKITDLSLGGGLARASAYRAQRSDFDALAGEVVRALGGGVTLALEPGRYLVDDAAVGLTCVLGLHHVGVVLCRHD